MDPPVVLRGRQILDMVLEEFRTARGTGVSDRLDDFNALWLVDGREQEFLL